MRSRDTSERAAAIQEQLHTALGIEGRFMLAMRMSELAREFAKAGLRDRQPSIAEHQLLRELVRTFYGQ